MTLNELPELRDLPVSEKLEVSNEEQQLLDDRWSSFLKNPDSALTTGEFMDRLKALRA